MHKKTIKLFLFFLFPVCIFAQADGYTYKRKLNKVEKEGYYAVPLLPEIIAQCKSNLTDIRLYNIKENDTAEVPYIMEWLGEKRELATLSFDMINNSYTDKSASYITLKSAKKQTINQISLTIADANYDKSVKVEGSNDNKQWFTIAEHLRIVKFNDVDNHFEHNTLDFNSSEYAYFRLKFDDILTERINVTNAYVYKCNVKQGNYDTLKINKWKQTENKKDKTSEVIVELPYNYLVSYLTVKSSAPTDFYRNMNVYGTSGTYHTPKGDIENWYLLNTSVLSSIENHNIYCNNEVTKKIKIIVYNYDNAPITISEIKVYGEKSRLVANLPFSENIYLTYGKKNDHEPIYDIEHFKNKIPKELTEINYGTEQAKITPVIKQNQLMESKKWLWIIMGVVILLIGYFALNMLKKEGK